MRFKNQETQFPGKKKLIKVNGNNVPIAGELPILVNIVKDEGETYIHGTPINAENLNKGNWRDDDSLSFKMRAGGLPEARPDETQIVTATDGKTWIIPPEGLGCAKEIRDRVGSVVTIGGCKEDIGFVSDPQTQLNGKLDKITSTAENVRAYCVDGLGNQTMGTIENLNDIGSAGDIPRRNGNRSLTMPTPVDNDDVATKKYVDAQATTKQSKVTASYIATNVLRQTSGVYLTRVKADTGVTDNTVDAIVKPGNNLTLATDGTLNVKQKYIHSCTLGGSGGGRLARIGFTLINEDSAQYTSIAQVVEACRVFAGTGEYTYIPCTGIFEYGNNMYVAYAIRGGVPGELLMMGVIVAGTSEFRTNTPQNYWTQYTDNIKAL